MKTSKPQKIISGIFDKVLKFNLIIIITLFLIFSGNSATKAGNIEKTSIEYKTHQIDTLKTQEKKVEIKSTKENRVKKENKEKKYFTISIDINYN